MADSPLSFFEKELINELRRISNCLEEIRDLMPIVDAQERIAEYLSNLTSIAEDLTSIDKSITYIDGKIE